MAPTRPKGILLDIGDTLLRETGYGVADGVAALQPLCGRGEQLAIEFDAKISYTRRHSAAEFSVVGWLTGPFLGGHRVPLRSRDRLMLRKSERLGTPRYSMTRSNSSLRSR